MPIPFQFGHARIEGYLQKYGKVMADYDISIGLSSSLTQLTASYWNDVRGPSGFGPQLSASGLIIYDTGSNQLTQLGSGSFSFNTVQGGNWNPINPLSLCVFSTIPIGTGSFWASINDSISANSYVAFINAVNGSAARTIKAVSGFSDTFADSGISIIPNIYRTCIACCGSGSTMGTTGSAIYTPNRSEVVNTIGYTINQNLNASLVLFNIWPGANASQGQYSQASISMRGCIVVDHVINQNEANYLSLFGTARYGCIPQ